jgi:hypothetical protein
LCVTRYVHKGQHVSAEAAGVGHDDAQSRLRSDYGVGRRSSGTQHLLTCGNRKRMRRRHGPEPPAQNGP